MEQVAVSNRRAESAATLSLGAGQLSLIEHALCPLAARPTEGGGWVHESCYQFSDSAGQRRTAHVRVICPLGLTPIDEFYLWGLLALTLSQQQPTSEFHATPHYCLRQLGVIDQQARRGGRQYSQFAQSLERLSAVTYQNDGFYDPVRREHRRVAFGFLSYCLPLDPASSRAWRIVWDTVFLEFASAIGGHLRFDLAIYRQLDPASRRLFLLVSKIFRRQPRTPSFDLRFLGEHVLGFSASLAARDLKVKVKRCVERLAEHDIVAIHEQPPIRSSRNGDAVKLTRGPHYDRRQRSKIAMPSVESPLADLMRQIGLDKRSIARCLTRFSKQLLDQWLDITLAAREKKGESFFSKSAAAYFVDNVQKAAQGKRTPPDWWHDLVRTERRLEAESVRQTRDLHGVADKDGADPLLAAMTNQFRAAGQTAGLAAANAQRFIDACSDQDREALTANLLRILVK